MPSLILLFVAFGLLVLAGTSIGRARGRTVSRGDGALMAGMTGIALGSLLTIMPVLPHVLFPASVVAVLIAAWVRRHQLDQLGAFLVGGGLLVGAMNGIWLVNDLTDPAVSFPGWTPIPLASAIAAVILGSALLVAARRSPD